MNERTNHNDGAFPDELISAYLDDELSPAEKLRVEEQLMDSAEHRQLFEELKALRSGMQSLPKQTLDANFAARVLQRAEKQLLADEEPGDTKPTAPKPTAAMSVATSDDRGAWRGLIWSVSAMAAAIMLIVFSPWLTNQSEIGHRGVAVNQGTEDPPNETNSNEPNEEKLAKDRSEKGQTAQRVDTIRTAGQEVGAKDGGDDVNELNVAHNNIQQGNFDGRSNSGSRGRETTDLQQVTKGLGNHTAVDLDGAGARFAGDVVRKSRDEIELASRAAQTESFDGLPRTFSSFQQMHETRDGVPAQFRNHLDAADQLAADMMVVVADVTPEALSEHFLDEMLAKHNIRTNRVEEELAKASLAQGFTAEDRFAASKNEKSKQDDQAQQLSELQALSRDKDGGKLDQLRIVELESLRRQRADNGSGKARTAQGDVDVMVVVATPAQIDGLLSDMRSQSKYVLAIAADRPQLAAKKSQTALAYRSVADAEKQLTEDKTLQTADTSEERLKETARGSETATSKPNENQLVAGARAEGVSAVADGAIGGGGEGAAAPANNGNATPALDNRPQQGDRSLVQEQAEDFRGIARRLHLPENFQKDLVPSNKRFANSTDQYALPVAPSSQGIAQQGQGQGGGQARGGAVLPPASSVADDDPAGRKLNVGPAGGGFAAEAEEQPLVRVLFVLRATSGVPTAAVPEPAIPADSLPGADVPANAALKEAAIEAEPASADE